MGAERAEAIESRRGLVEILKSLRESNTTNRRVFKGVTRGIEHRDIEDLMKHYVMIDALLSNIQDYIELGPD